MAWGETCISIWFADVIGVQGDPLAGFTSACLEEAQNRHLYALLELALILVTGVKEVGPAERGCNKPPPLSATWLFT